jgi:hypothetical protein
LAPFYTKIWLYVGHWTASDLETFAIRGGNIVFAFGTEPPLYHNQDALSIFLAQLGILSIPFPLHDPFQQVESPLQKGFYLSEGPSPTAVAILSKNRESQNAPLLYTRGFGMKIEPMRHTQAHRLYAPMWTTVAFSNDFQQAHVPGSDLALVVAFQTKSSTLDSKSRLPAMNQEQNAHIKDYVLGRVTVFGSDFLLSDASLS